MVTMKDIAKRAGVSLITVSRVVNNSGYVSKETRAKVEAAIDELHFVPNMVASSLRSQRSDLLALILPDITNSFWTSIARGAEDEAWAHGYGVFICNTDNVIDKEKSYIERILRRRVEGVLFVPTPFRESELQLRRLRQQGAKFVVIHQRHAGFEADVVRSDGETAAQEMTAEVIRRGHTRIAFAGLPFADISSSDRLRGFRRAHQVAGIPVDESIIVSGEAGKDGAGGYRLVQEVLAQSDPPTAMLLANSRVALGGLRAISDAGLTIPDDLCVAAFHDINMLDPWAPKLIRAVQPSYRMGQLATRRLLEIGTPGEGPYKEIILHAELFLA
jgi:LacI family transcriptional regulator